MLLAPVQALPFTGMGGATGVYDGTDMDRCDTGGTSCVARDNEAFYTRPGGDDGTGWDLISGSSDIAGGPHGHNGDRKVRSAVSAFCPKAFDCNGVAPPLYHPNNYL
mmetsp:Transcript_66197/g.96923  ORF Transcript_66197/g.96923 Transcript_66197/m.96923 type:complete len:107 (+) Transcript_66197:56-376(+)